MSGLLTVTVKDTGKVEKFVNPQHVEDVYPEGTDVRVRLYPRVYFIERALYQACISII